MVALRQYQGVWRIPGAPLMMTFGIIGRLGIGMTPLALLLVVQNATGSYSLAAVAGAVYAIAGAALGPVAGRVADRVGPTPVLLVTATAHPLALAGAAARRRPRGRARVRRPPRSPGPRTRRCRPPSAAPGPT